MAKAKKARNLTGKKCGCAKGAVKKSTKGKGRGFVCMKAAPMNRFVAKNANGSCPSGSKVKTMTNKNGTKIKRCSKTVTRTKDGKPTMKFDKMVCS
jgi:hypothetical protein